MLDTQASGSKEFPVTAFLLIGGAVYLNPNTGRFWTTDTQRGAQREPFSLHKYLYCFDSPVDRADPTGCDSDLATVLVTVSGIGTSAGLLSPSEGQVQQRATGAGTRLRIMDSKESPTFRKRWLGVIAELMRAGRGQELVTLAEHFQAGVIIEPDPGDPVTGGSRISPVTGRMGDPSVIELDAYNISGIGPDAPILNPEPGEPKASPEEIPPENWIGAAAVLAHELGHAVYPGSDPLGDDPFDEEGKPTGGKNVGKNENPVREFFGMELRRHYHGRKIPDDLILIK
jgi:hypothetical protein